MAVSWGAEQVLALAPDAGSAKSGKELSSPRKWSNLGAGESVLWGECQGSGASPYQTKVELSEPAFHCSCPSRKFPCKHALGLFLLWIGQPKLFAQAAPPVWVTSWLEGRAQKAEKEAEKERQKQEKGEPAVDPASQQRREAARMAKVAAGLDDLGLWLGDLVRQGLAAVQGKPGGFWEEQARRMVDAQAPGVARRLRQIEALKLSGDGWQANLLDRLARLHLLVEGRRRMEALPAEVQDDLRATIGVTVDQDAVRAGPGVRDVWQVVGQRVTVEDRLKAQRTWLIGRDTGRPALVLDFAYGAMQPLDTSLPPGIAVDADLAFFPGSVPLRALVKQRHAPPGPIEAPRGHATVADAYTAYAGALARNPWLELYPMVLEGVVLQVGGDGPWTARDASGGVLPLSSRFDRGWTILAVSGGHPVTLVGEFDGEALEPLAYWSEGRYRVLATTDQEPAAPGMPPLDGPAELTTTWQEATTSALVGVDRKPPPSAPGADPLGRLLSGLEAVEAPARLLGVAAATSLYGRVGRKPATDPNPAPEPCGPDDQPPCDPAQGLRLRRILDGEHPKVLPEWLDLLAASGRRLPDEAIPEALNLGHRQSELRPVLRKVLGARGRWLAARNPEWSYVGGDAEQADPDAVWQTGSRAERRVALRALRGREPDRARALLESTWARESADDRAVFVESLEVGLGMADEPFLEAALDDRSKQVRRASAELLSLLPDSRFGRRMVDRASGLLRWDGKKLSVTLPQACDEATVRDGIEPKPPSWIGEKAFWLRQIAALTPIGAWGRLLKATPAQLMAAAREGKWKEDLWTPWTEAAIRARDAEWVEALVVHAPWREIPLRDDFGKLLEVLPRDRRDVFVIDRLNADDGPLRAKHPAFNLLGQIRSPLGLDAGREVLRRIRKIVDEEHAELWKKTGGESFRLESRPTYNARLHDYQIYHFIEGFLGTLVPHELADEAERGVPCDEFLRTYYGPPYLQFLDRLRFRHEMHEEFAR